MAVEWQQFFRQVRGKLAGAWGRHPLVLAKGEAALRGRLTLADVAPLVDSGLLPAGCAALGAGARDWRSVPLSGPLAEVLPSATAYANNAGLYLSTLAEVCLAAVQVLGWPTTCNAYLSGSGLAVSVPPHTDRQDVLVLQTSGRKRWTVFAPPAVGPVDPLRRGKDGDAMLEAELGEHLMDVTLSAGDALYVPLGFPHSTSTLLGGAGADEEPSVHITLNLDSLIWGLSYRMLWIVALRRARLRRGMSDPPEEGRGTEGMTWQRYAALQAPLPLGFVEEEAAGACVQGLAGDLSRRVADWTGGEVPQSEELGEGDVEAALAMLLEHRGTLLELHRHMYLDVLLDLSKAPPLEREMGHWQLLQEQMGVLRRSMGWE
uniref:Bifunctional lysine-specific demethylase and histidyl-hydroxylase n=1 Tax=Alexandrium monilatum TaxID=311494 RepID=A0A7S4VSF2_9DINO